MTIINVVHLDLHYNDDRRITAAEIKLKSVAENEGGSKLTGHELTATVAAGFFKTTLLADEGISLEIKPNAKRGDIINIVISFREDTQLTVVDIANFVTALQEAIDESKLF